MFFEFWGGERSRGGARERDDWPATDAPLPYVICRYCDSCAPSGPGSADAGRSRKRMVVDGERRERERERDRRAQGGQLLCGDAPRSFGERCGLQPERARL